MPTRDLGLSHGAGKGDKDRSDPAAFQRGFGNIVWGREADGFERKGNRLVKRYGPAARPEIESIIALPPAPAHPFYPTGILK